MIEQERPVGLLPQQPVEGQELPRIDEARPAGVLVVRDSLAVVTSVRGPDIVGEGDAEGRRSDNPSANCRIVARAMRQGASAGCPRRRKSAANVRSVNPLPSSSVARRYG